MPEFHIFSKLLTQRSLDNVFLRQPTNYTWPKWRFIFELKCVTCNITRVVIFLLLGFWFLFQFFFFFSFFPLHFSSSHFHCICSQNICWSAAFFFFYGIIATFKCEAGASLSELWIVGYYKSTYHFEGISHCSILKLNSLWMATLGTYNIYIYNLLCDVWLKTAKLLLLWLIVCRLP